MTRLAPRWRVPFGSAARHLLRTRGTDLLRAGQLMREVPVSESHFYGMIRIRGGSHTLELVNGKDA